MVGLKLVSLVSFGLHGAALALYKKADPEVVANQSEAAAVRPIPAYPVRPRPRYPKRYPLYEPPELEPPDDPLVEPSDPSDDPRSGLAAPPRDPQVEPSEPPDDPDDPQPGPPGGDPIDYYDVDFWRSVRPVFDPNDEASLLNGTNAQKNLCYKGYLMPELLVIGAIKAGTTTLCTELEYSPSMIFPHSREREDREAYPAKWKEGHYFDYFQLRGVEFMLGDYMKCDKAHRRIGVDGSARYAVDQFVPPLIKKWYGPFSRRIKFVFVMREPLQRLQSHYYHGATKNWCKDFNTMTFKGMISKLMYNLNYESRWRGSTANKAFGGGCGDFIEASIYPKQIERYFSYFSSSQFTMIPFKFVVYPADDMHPAAYFFKRLRVKGLPPPELHENDRQHPDLNTDLTPMQRAWMSRFFYHRTSPVMIAQLLAKSQATLFAYRRIDPFKRKTVSDIAGWLSYNW